MGDWRTWNLERWNQQLLEHFFRRRDDHSSVVVLLVTADELARATGDAGANAEEVRDAFVRAVCVGVARAGSLLEHASDYQEWPGHPCFDSFPRFAAHLFFTCIAASESSDELGDEGSFVLRLRELSDDQLPENSLQMLPLLWEHLARWLSENDKRYRSLTLPSPGGLTRIGYTVKLAFPDRRDQRQLSDLLDRAGLAGHEPPVGRVISLVASEKNRFRRSFVAAFEDFRRLFHTPARSAARLMEHRFWAAVREAALRGRGQAGILELPVRVSLFGDEQEDRLALFIVAEGASETDEFAFASLPVSYGEWRYALVPRGTDAIRVEALDEIVVAALSGALRFPRISSHVQQGVIPLVVGTHGLLELATQEQLPEVSIALVKEALLADFIRCCGDSTTVTRASAYSGWVQVHGPVLRMLPSEDLERTTLRQVWYLHESLMPTTIRVVGGVRADDGWVGAREVLPRIVARGASSVFLARSEGREALAKVDGDEWALPNRDVAGEFVLIATLEGDVQERRAICFHAAPASEAFKMPAEPDAWIVESLGGTVTLSETLPFSSAPADLDCQDYADRVAHLGADVGRFVVSLQDAAWRITQFGGKFVGARGPLCGESVLPTSQILDAHARRRWRRMLFESVPSPSDPGFDQARRQVKRGASSHTQLPRLDADQIIPDLAAIVRAFPADAADRFVRILSGRASTRAGLAWSDWAELAQRVLDIDAHGLGAVTRAWMEAGLIDVASCARWWHRSIVVRKPRLVGFRIGDHVGATLTGLALPTTRDELKRTALRMDIAVEERLSVCEQVPRSITFRLQSVRHFDELGLACRLEVCWLDFESMSNGATVRHDGTTMAPSHYEWVRRWPQWSLRPGEHGELQVDHCMRRDRPDFWIVCHGERQVWSYDLNVARAWAATLLEIPMLKVVGDAFIEASHAYLPLPLARALAVIGAGLPGPTADGGYRYPVGSPRLRERALDIVTRTFDPSRLAAGAARQSIG